MQGWLKLMETYRKSGSSSTPSVRSLPNRNLNSNNTLSRQQNSLSMTNNTNGHIETIHTLDSPPNIFNSPSIISLDSTPRHTVEDISYIDLELASSPRLIRDIIPIIELESTSATVLSSSSFSSTSTSINIYFHDMIKQFFFNLGSKKSPERSKKIIIRKSHKSSGISPPVTEDISDDDIPLVDIRKQKTKSIDTLSIPSIADSMIPLATDLVSLPGHIQEETRDIRFLNYIDPDTLANHLNTCLYIDKKSFSPAKQYIFKTRYNVLHKIFRFYYLKTFRSNLFKEKKSFSNKKDNQKQTPLSIISSPTSTSFKMDWTVNRRQSSSTHRQEPKNFFHILQLQPKDRLSVTNQTISSTTKTPVETFEHIKDILARTYYPHLHTAIECGYQFGTKSKFPNVQQLVSTHDEIIPIKEMPQSPDLFDDSVTITLKSPPSTRFDSTINLPSSLTTKKCEQNSIINNYKSSSTISIESQTSEENEEDLSPLIIRKSFVVLTPTKLPISSPPPIDQDKKLTNNRKRKVSATTITTNHIERKKKRIISSPSLEIINHIEDITDPERYILLILTNDMSIRHVLQISMTSRICRIEK